jgi:hypothetical protein
MVINEQFIRNQLRVLNKEQTLPFNWQKLRQWPIRRPIARSPNLYILAEKHWPLVTKIASLVNHSLPLIEGPLHCVPQFWSRALQLLWFCSKNWIIKVSNFLFQTLNSRLSSRVATYIFHEWGTKNVLWSPLWGFS